MSDKVYLEGGASSQYLYDNPVFRFVSIDNLKRSGKIGDPTSVVLVINEKFLFIFHQIVVNWFLIITSTFSIPQYLTV